MFSELSVDFLPALKICCGRPAKYAYPQNPNIYIHESRIVGFFPLILMGFQMYYQSFSVNGIGLVTQKKVSFYYSLDC